MTSDPGTRVAIVTGGSGGIGRVVVERLAADELSVVIHYAGNAEPAKDAITAITAAGGSRSTRLADARPRRVVSTRINPSREDRA